MKTMTEQEKMQALREWFTERFNFAPEKNPSYFNDWVRRMDRGTLAVYADNESLKSLKKYNLI